MQIDTLLLLVAFLCFVLDALAVTSRVNLQSLGLAFAVLTFLV